MVWDSVGRQSGSSFWLPKAGGPKGEGFSETVVLWIVWEELGNPEKGGLNSLGIVIDSQAEPNHSPKHSQTIPRLSWEGLEG